jgi:hypothetical protein
MPVSAAQGFVLALAIVRLPWCDCDARALKPSTHQRGSTFPRVGRLRQLDLTAFTGNLFCTPTDYLVPSPG